MKHCKKRFPENFPEECPPEKAKIEKIYVYRLIKGDNPEENDFKSFIDMKKKFNVNKKYPFIEYGISVFTDYKELNNMRLGSILLKKNYKSLAGGYTYLCTGVIQYTPGKTRNFSHVTWWLYRNINPANYFKKVER